LKKLSIVLIIFLSLSAGGIDKGSLLLPLTFDSYRTSSFGEYRYNHFHGGVDFSTNGEEGFPVLAVGDGKISRIKREPEGYGRALYLDLEDGRTAVYGHLIRFSGKLGIEQKLYEECVRKDTSFPGDIFFDPPVEVKAGDVVAYSGQLGIGSPHLHLEIRRGDSMLDPLNEGVPLPEFSTPKIKSVCFSPRDPGATVNGSLFPVQVGTAESIGGTSILTDSVSLGGGSDIYLSVSDNMGSPVYTTIPCEIEAKIDGKEFFYLNFKDISLAHYKESVFLYEPFNGSGPFILLRKRPEIQIGEIRGSGLPHLEKGKHQLEIAVRNRGGKSAVLKSQITAGGPAVPLQTFIDTASLQIEDCRLLSNGVGITAIASPAKGTSSITIGNRPAGFYLSRENSKHIEILVPSDQLSQKGEKITAGKKELSGWFAKGPANIAEGSFRLSLPPAAIAKYSSGGGSVSVEVAPEGLRSLAQIACSKAVSGGEALFASGKYFFSYIGGKERSLGKSINYQIVKDITAPVWGAPKLGRIKNLDEPELRIPVNDALSGINPRSISVYIDSKRVFPDWDSDASLVRIGVSGLPKGAHAVSGHAEDKTGNRAELPLTKFFI
jgi:hypothetical protein